ncbi:sulfite exporter TauE/SafE family protein [Candidatus Gracilibacteria bacterium]|nr:sulfite exporter TauE/SafE family protein [Candidatus Gracilibacteria bacterium]
MEYIILIASGILIGIIGVVFGGSMLLSMPLFQILFPTFSYGQIIGNIQAGSLARGIASTISTRKHLDLKKLIPITILFIIGSASGSALIAKLDQKYLVFAIIIAIILSELSPKIAPLINNKTRYIASLFVGLYVGTIAAGSSIMLFALLRTVFHEKDQIVTAKIQARFIETLGIITVVITHIFYGNIIFPVWIFWAIGSFIGGLLGGAILKKSISLKPKTQQIYIYCVYLVALIPTIIKALN